MICSRGYICAKLLQNSQKLLKPSLNNVAIRNSGRWAYRSVVEATKSQRTAAEYLGSIMWGWVIYHCINDLDHITGEYHTPDPALWTDEELGIPPDSEGPAPRVDGS